MLSASRIVRSASASLALLAMLLVSVAAFSPAHTHAGLKTDACVVCSASDLPSLAVDSPAPVWPPAEPSEPSVRAATSIALDGHHARLGGRSPPTR